MRKGLLLLGLAFVVLALASPAQATSIDFSKGALGAGGEVTVFSDNSLLGVGIPIGSMVVTDAPTNNGAFLVNGILNFSTGGLAGAAGLALGFAETNFIAVLGGIPDLNIADDTLLLYGTISSYLVTYAPLGLVLAQGEDAKSPLLLDALGIAPGTPFTYFGSSTATVTPLVVGEPQTVNSTDINNQTVPEPGTMLLLGTGLIGLAGAIRRRLKK